MSPFIAPNKVKIYVYVQIHFKTALKYFTSIRFVEKILLDSRNSEISECAKLSITRDVNKFLSSRFVKGVTHSISSRNLYSFRVFVFLMKIFTSNIESAQP